MRFKIPFTGVHIGERCVDGTAFGIARAHAHIRTGKGKHPPYTGYICARNEYELMKYLRHEVAHLLTNAGHDTAAEEAAWQAGHKSIGGRVAARRKH